MGLLKQLASRWTDPDRIAIDAAESISYQELLARAHRAQGLLREHGLTTGDVVAVQLPKCPEFIEVLLGALGEGVTVLPLNPRAPCAEIDALLAIAQPTLVIGPNRDLDPGSLRDALDRATPRTTEDIAPETIALLCFTSGTTGRPKGALLSHRALIGNLRALHDAWQWRADDVLLHVLPLFHIHGLLVAQLGALWAGATTKWMHPFDPEQALQRLTTEDITVLMGVPTTHHRLLAAAPSPVRLPLRLCTSGSAPLAAETHRRFTERFGVEIVERYGMTEIGIVLSNPVDGARKPGSVGLPLPGVGCKITDPDTGDPVAIGEIGEVRISGPTLMTGYLDQPEATERAIGDGWMHTGDLGRIDADGYVHLLGRRGDLILFGGFNVYPLEVESVIATHPDVREVAVVGVPDADKGEIPAAMLVGPVDAKVLSVWLRDRLSAYKIPRRWMRVDRLPRNPTGKIRRAAVRDALLAHRE